MNALKSASLIISVAIFASCQSFGNLDHRNEASSHHPGDTKVTAAPESSERLVTALWRAADAEKKGDKEGLLLALITIDALGAQPMGEDDEAALTRWRQQISEEQLPMRGRMLGPGFKSGNLAPGTSVSLEQIFVGGEAAQIALSSQENQSVHVRVTDFNDKEVCAKSATEVSCRWLPLFTQRHRIELVNPGRTDVGYYLAIE